MDHSVGRYTLYPEKRGQLIFVITLANIAACFFSTQNSILVSV